MSIAIVLTRQKDVRLVHWAARIAQGRHEGLVLIWANKRPGKGGTQRLSTRDCEKIRTQLPEELVETCDKLHRGPFSYIRDEDDGANGEKTDLNRQLGLEIVLVASKQIQSEIASAVVDLGVSCLIVPREPQLHAGSPEANTIDHLLRHVPCEIVLLTAGSDESGACDCIVTPLGQGPHSASCLRMANDIAKIADARLVALHVEPEVDMTARQAAERILQDSVKRALGSDQQQVTQRVVLSNDVVDGIKEAADEKPNLIIIGMRRAGIVRRFSSQGIAEKLVNSHPGPSIAIVQSAMPLRSRVGRRLDQLLQSYVPQLPRDRRVRLVQRIQLSSQWDFDFIALILMSTLIAAGGLIQDSAAVVIGAMLVAPLMTPLLGTGLSITQGNIVLFRSTLLTVLRGFLLAFVTSFVVGTFAADRVTSEMAARGTPRVLDILVAAVGGIAAAYASGRPNLLSALPGVAIAASLVPPIATAGIAMSHPIWQPGLSFRAAMLFFTNIVAIVLGTWLAFRAVGIRGMHQHSNFDRWTIGAGATLILLVLSLGIYESMPGSDSNVVRLQARLNQFAVKDVWSCSDVEYTYVDGVKVLSVHIDSKHAMSPEVLRAIRENVAASFPSPPPLQLITTVLPLEP